jgi:hypothetical protein
VTFEGKSVSESGEMAADSFVDLEKVRGEDPVECARVSNLMVLALCTPGMATFEVVEPHMDVPGYTEPSKLLKFAHFYNQLLTNGNASQLRFGDPGAGPSGRQAHGTHGPPDVNLDDTFLEGFRGGGRQENVGFSEDDDDEEFERRRRKREKRREREERKKDKRRRRKKESERKKKRKDKKKKRKHTSSSSSSSSSSESDDSSSSTSSESSSSSSSKVERRPAKKRERGEKLPELDLSKRNRVPQGEDRKKVQQRIASISEKLFPEGEQWREIKKNKRLMETFHRELRGLWKNGDSISDEWISSKCRTVIKDRNWRKRHEVKQFFNPTISRFERPPAMKEDVWKRIVEDLVNNPKRSQQTEAATSSANRKKTTNVFGYAGFKHFETRFVSSFLPLLQ